MSAESNAKKTPSASVNWRTVALLTAGAIALYAGFRLLPTGTNLHHLDFQVKGAGALEMCDPSNPQFIPVVEARSPVRTTLRAADGAAPRAGEESRFVLTLETANGRPVAPVDLLTVHTRKLHLLVIDPTLGDYRHLHPEPGARPGEWVFAHTPARGGVYRVFADFTPAATGRGLYSFADYTAATADSVSTPAAGAGGPAFAPTRLGTEAEIGAWRFTLATEDGAPMRAGKPAALVFSGREAGGGAVPLTLVMDAYAHLVAFDAARAGFAHLHPRGQRPGDYAVGVPDAVAPKLWFDLTIPQAGDYVVWAQVNLEGREHFLSFALPVGP